MFIFARVLKEHLLKLVILAAFFAFIAFMIAVVQPREYRASGRLIIVSKGAVELDAYTAARAGERLGSILQEVIYSGKFLDAVLATGLVRNDYPKDEEKRMRLWKKRVVTRVSETSGILAIDVFHTNRAMAVATAQAIFETAQDQAPIFYGGYGVDIQEVELPGATQRPVRPKLLVATAGGFLAGTVVGVGLLFLMAPEMAQKRRRDWPPDSHFGAIPEEVV